MTFDAFISIDQIPAFMYNLFKAKSQCGKNPQNNKENCTVLSRH